MSKKILLFAGTVIVIFVLMNWGYFQKQIQYEYGLTKAQPQNVQTNTIPTPEQPHEEPNQLSIPSLNITAPIVYVDQVDENLFQKNLQNGVVHYPGTAEIGQPGNAYIFGHSSDYPFTPGKYKTVFALLPRIEKGAEILVTDKNGLSYTYEVIDQFVVNNNNLQVLDQREYKEKLLSLQTSYPVGTALKRYIVLARLKR